MRTRTLSPLRLLVLLALVALTTFAVACENTTYVGVSYGYPGWGGPCCYYGPAGGWTTGVYMGGPVW
jgi:hypothetical protein